jgi:hypothetical protein
VGDQWAAVIPLPERDLCDVDAHESRWHHHATEYLVAIRRRLEEVGQAARSNRRGRPSVGHRPVAGLRVLPSRWREWTREGCFPVLVTPMGWGNERTN